MLTGNQSEAADYLEYLLSGQSDPKIQQKYLNQIIEKRSDPTEPDQWIGFDGKKDKKNNKDKIYLPKPFI